MYIYIAIYGMYGTERAGCYMHPHPPTRPYKNISENTKKSTKPKNIFRYLSPTSLIHVSYHIATNCVPRHVCSTW